MQLYHREFGAKDAPPIIILHGLFGSSNSWLSVARSLASRFRVHLFDLRNHGRSPHAATGTIEEMAGDVRAAALSVESRPVRLLGHSLGGKVAMRAAVSNPKLVTRLIVVDIAPRAYAPISAELEALRALDLSAIDRRSEADELLKAVIPDDAIRLFLLTNLTRSGDGSLTWRCNLDALHTSMPDMRSSPLTPGETFEGPTTFLLGELSDYVVAEDHATIRAHFPDVSIRPIPGCGHNPHIDDREAFEREVLIALSSASRSSSSSYATRESSD